MDGEMDDCLLQAASHGAIVCADKTHDTQLVLEGLAAITKTTLVNPCSTIAASLDLS